VGEEGGAFYNSVFLLDFTVMIFLLKVSIVDLATYDDEGFSELFEEIKFTNIWRNTMKSI
jgi:hypothetical protein